MELKLKLDTKLNIMIVDDDEAVRNTVRDYIEFMDIFTQIIEAKNGGEAFVKFQNQNFDIIVTDINMPNKDGLEFIGSIKKAQAGHDKTPIVILSANINSENAKKAKELGVKYALLKPCTMDEFIEKISKILLKEKKDKFDI